MELIKNTKVVFNADKHVYTLFNEQTFETKYLQGVTKMIKSVICPDLYKDVDEQTLARAAEKGSRLHHLCEMYDNGEIFRSIDGKFYHEDTEITDTELSAYVSLIEKHKFTPIASEYLVSDNKDFASCIDKVMILTKKSVAIVDLKFTYSFNEEPVTWQTSLYADWFEAQNPTLKVKKLYCIHIHQYKDKLVADVHELQRVPTEALEQLKEYWLMMQNGIELPPFDNPMKQIGETLNWSETDERKLMGINNQIKELTKLKDEYVQAMKARFAENTNVNKYVGKLITFSRSFDKHKLVFDEDKFRDEHPDLYKQYMCKDKVTSGRVTLSIN